uniref:Zinc finger protein 653 n=1 Tax=Pelodiscus sinensis TaxID=13735 RepID=K7FG91_PELSI
ETDDLYGLKKEELQPPPEMEMLEELEPAHGNTELEPEELDSNDMSAIIYEIPKEPEKRRRSRRGRVMDADGMLEMFHCPYEGCSQNHVNLVHRKGKTKVCPHPGCGKKFYLSNHLRRHMIIHSALRPRSVHDTGAGWARDSSPGAEMRPLLGGAWQLCEICGYQCRQRASLNWHMKKHTAEVQYNFTCEHCGKRFEKLDSVKFHKLKSHPDHKAT